MSNLVAIIDQKGVKVTEEMKQELQKTFVPLFEGVEEELEQARAIVVTDESQVDVMKQADALRKILKKKRSAVENKRKELKNYYVQTGKAIDSIANHLKELIEPIESHLQEQATYAVRMEEKRRQDRKDKRIAALSQYGPVTEFAGLETMPEESFEMLLAGKKAEYEKIQREKEETERLKRLGADRLVKLQSFGGFFALPHSDKDLSAISEEEFQAIYNEVAENKKTFEEEQERIRKENERIRKENKRLQREAEAREAELKKAKAQEEAQKRAEEERKEAILCAGDKGKVQDLFDQLNKIKYIKADSKKAASAIENAMSYVQQACNELENYLED
jgi:hypothetical protein